MEKCRARGTLLVPYWSCVKFWPVQVNNESNFESFVKDYRFLKMLKSASCMIITKISYWVWKNLKEKLCTREYPL